MWLLLLACQTPPSRVVIVGMDGLEYSLLDRMIEQGELPAFKTMMAEGARGELQIPAPVMSPIVWTTLSTGYPPDVHGIGGWTHGDHFSNAGDVQADRLWEVATAAQLPVLISGWLLTWPAAPVTGQLVSDRYIWSAPLDSGAQMNEEEGIPYTTFPSKLSEELGALRPDADWLLAQPLGYQVRRWGPLAHPLRRDETQVRIWEKYWKDQKLSAIYLNGADQISHLYWPFVDPGTAARIRRDPEARQEAVARAVGSRRVIPFAEGLDAAAWEEAAHTVPDYYRYLDGVLARVLAKIGTDTTLILCSDHGFSASTREPLTVGSHRAVGVLLARGPGIQPGKVGALDLVDFAPTVYALLGLPAAEDMPGKAWTQIFPVKERPRVPSYKRQVAPSGPGANDDKLRRQLEALGYLSLPDEEAIGASRQQR
jgi:predicted AlkP superfamily phosphohydrolase/phosphomutase